MTPLALLSSWSLSEADCCGIIGYVGREEIAEQVVAEGINLLQNRGYDSSGIATIGEGEIRIDKRASNESLKIDCI